MQVVFGFSQTIYKNGNAIRCLRLCPEGQHLLETDSQALEMMLPSFIKFEGMEEPNRPGAIWYLTLMAAAILDVEPIKLVDQHKKTMARLYGERFEEGICTLCPVNEDVGGRYSYFA